MDFPGVCMSSNITQNNKEEKWNFIHNIHYVTATWSFILKVVDGIFLDCYLHFRTLPEKPWQSRRGELLYMMTLCPRLFSCIQPRHDTSSWPVVS